ncbi:hypothetical protein CHINAEXTREME_16360 [Halobiforma lacisalsi AJ5]|uniref:Uncharacterized protein n=1 Tax=Natronobacterium lacisalsi AJ5 TaxID=358396 RepID=M0LB60_NATLA|nr:DUF5804 family protein [Halobiforma lacisalsi]APW99247.1 hypothetical protein CHINAEXTREME_16360 [Halobiforma lacisalsi AJ5]EMA30816.1 hypothetical protein C445_15956 [Halobiforma lacisalsi AJ5]
MTRVCLIGNDDVNLQYELLSRETSREALATYDLRRPFENSLAVRTVSVGAAVTLLNDLQWYLTRFVDTALVQEPSISDEEWLSRSLATQLRNGDVEPRETDEFCKVYGLERVDRGEPNAAAERDGDGAEDTQDRADDSDAENGGDREADATLRLVEPLYVRRTDGELPAYDLREVEETLVVRLTESEYSP